MHDTDIAEPRPGGRFGELSRERGARRGHPRRLESMAAHAALFGLFNGSLGLFALLAPRLGRPLPRGYRFSDLLLLAVATQRASRILSKDEVTDFLRAPFTERAGLSDIRGEVIDRPRGRGLKRVVGELITNPFSLGQWVAALLTGSFVVAPRATRFVAGVLTVAALSDLLQSLYARARAEARESGSGPG